MDWPEQVRQRVGDPRAVLGDALGRATVHVTLARSWEPVPVEQHTIVVIAEEPSSTS
jgi:hypothetical protein